MKRVCLGATVGALLAFTAIAGPAAAATPKRTSSKIKLATKTTTTKLANGATRMHFVYGPVHIAPGQNSIFVEPNDQRPKVDGYVTRFAPNLILQDGTIPRVDQIHLHHAVWLVNRRPTWGAGEEKTTAATPKGYGWEYKTSDEWLMNHMIHDLLPSPETVYITYDIDFIPKTSPAAANITVQVGAVPRPDPLEPPRRLAAAAVAHAERAVDRSRRLPRLAPAGGVHAGHDPDAQCGLLPE